MYADLEYYKNTFLGKEELTEFDLEKASRHIDTLTYNRANNFNELTEYQKKIIQESTCMLAEFELENADYIDSIISSYSLNGASVSFGGASLKVVNGVCIKHDIYSHLQKSGLCCGVAR